MRNTTHGLNTKTKKMSFFRYLDYLMEMGSEAVVASRNCKKVRQQLQFQQWTLAMSSA